MIKKSLYWIKPFYISIETWNSLKDKERDYVCLVMNKKTKNEIMRKLYLSDRTSLHRLQKRVKEKIKNDVEKINKIK